jgi:hypothetical protein
MPDLLTLGTIKGVPGLSHQHAAYHQVWATPAEPRTVFNSGGSDSSVYYRDRLPVDASHNDGSIAPGSSQSFTAPATFIAAGTSASVAVRP